MLTEHTLHGHPHIHYAQGPDNGPPLILVHGITNNWRGFLPLLPELILRWHVIIPDLRGHGHSARTPGEYTIDHFASDIIRLTGTVAGEQAMLYGHSLGGATALRAAASRPELYRGVLLADPPLDAEHLRQHILTTTILPMVRELHAAHRSLDDLFAALARYPVTLPGTNEPAAYGALPGNNPIALRAWAASLLQTDPDVIITGLENRIYTTELLSLLPSVTCPLGIIQADPANDGLIPDVTAQRITRDYPHVLLTKLHRSWHVLHASDAEPVQRVIRQFFETIRLETT